MNHGNVLGHEALAYRLLLRQVEPLVVQLQTVQREFVSPIELLGRDLLKKHVDDSRVAPRTVVVF